MVVGGACNDRGTWAELAGALADDGFTAVSYDRRGRGDSGDTEPYAVAAELPVARISVLEPPYRVAGAPPPPPHYIATLQGYVDRDDRDGLAQNFQAQVVGLPAELVQSFRGTPMWAKLSAMALTLVHDGLCLGGDDHPLPLDLLGSVRQPVLAVTSSGTTSWLGQTAAQVAAALPSGEWVRLDGGYHQVPPEVLAPVLAGFYRR